MNEPEQQPDVCRVCRSEGTVEQPLFYPCLCSGSIKYIHQDCLVEWLKHYRKRYCELCKHPFTFSPVYAEQMPQKIPFSVLLLGLVKKSISWGRILFSLSFAVILWFLAVPIVTSQVFRYYFGWSLQGILSSAFPVEELNDALLETSLTVFFDVLQGFLLTGFTVFLVLGLMLLREFISMIRRTEPSERLPVNTVQRVLEGSETNTMANTFDTNTVTNTADVLSSTTTEPITDDLRSPLSPRISSITSPLSPIRRHSALSPTSNSSNTSNSNFWLDRVHPKEYRNYLRRRELHRQLMEAEQGRLDNDFIFANGDDQHEGDPLLVPEDHISNISGTTTLRSRMTNMTNATATTNISGSNNSFRCRICFSTTCINREHAIQATQLRNNLAAQRHQSLLERATREAQNETEIEGNEGDNEIESGNSITAGTAGTAGANAGANVGANTNVNTPNTNTRNNANPVNRQDEEVFGWNLDAAESLSFPEFFGFTLEGTPVLELLQNSAIVIGCNTLVMHLFLFVPFITGRACSDGTLLDVMVKIVKTGMMLFVKPETISYVADFIQFRVIASEFLFSLSFNKYIQLLSIESDSVASFIGNIVLGYCVLCSILSVYLRFTSNFKDAFHRVFVPGISFIGTFIKLLSLLFIEMFMFPLICGFMIDYSCLSLFPGVTFLDRLQHVKSVPISGLSVHWALGAFFMISFASFVTFLRSYLRPGLLFFLRNPLDPDNHPVKEMVERGFIDQMIRLAYSVLFYSFLIACSVGLTVKSLSFSLISRHIFPLNLKFNDPLLEIPIDIILQIVLRSLWKTFSPMKLFKSVFIGLSKRLLRTLNLSSYFLGGGRYLSEESFPRGGKWVAVPDFDRLYNRQRLKEIRSKIVTPVDISKLKIVTDKQGQPVLDSSINTGGRITNDWTVVFRPKFFKLKCLITLAATISALQVFFLIFLIGPLLTGRWIVKCFTVSSLHSGPVHEVYSWSAGALIVMFTFKFIEFLVIPVKRRRSQSTNENEEDDELSLIDKVTGTIRLAMKSLLVGFFVFFLWPLQVGLLCSLIINPILYSENENTLQIVYFGACWSLGFPILRFLYSIKSHLPLPATTISYRTTSFESIDTVEFCKRVAIPVTILFTSLLVLPPLSSLLLINLFTGSSESIHLQQSSHILAISAYILLKLLKLIVSFYHRTITGIRDDTYLIGRRLHNLETRNTDTNNNSNSNNTTASQLT